MKTVLGERLRPLHLLPDWDRQAFTKHPEGVAQITFSDAEEADLCIKLLNNRWFSQRKITAETWDGKTKYKVNETEDDEKQRLMKWNKYLESTKPE